MNILKLEFNETKNKKAPGYVLQHYLITQWYITKSWIERSHVSIFWQFNEIVINTGLIVIWLVYYDVEHCFTNFEGVYKLIPMMMCCQKEVCIVYWNTIRVYIEHFQEFCVYENWVKAMLWANVLTFKNVILGHRVLKYK